MHAQLSRLIRELPSQFVPVREFQALAPAAGRWLAPAPARTNRIAELRLHLCKKSLIAKRPANGGAFPKVRGFCRVALVGVEQVAETRHAGERRLQNNAGLDAIPDLPAVEIASIGEHIEREADALQLLAAERDRKADKGET